MTTTLERILSEEYGVGSHRASPTAVIWAAERLADLVGVEEAKKQLAELNRSREKAGCTLAYVDFGSILF